MKTRDNTSIEAHGLVTGVWSEFHRLCDDGPGSPAYRAGIREGSMLTRQGLCSAFVAACLASKVSPITLREALGASADKLRDPAEMLRVLIGCIQDFPYNAGDTTVQIRRFVQAQRRSIEVAIHGLTGQINAVHQTEASRAVGESGQQPSGSSTEYQIYVLDREETRPYSPATDCARHDVVTPAGLVAISSGLLHLSVANRLIAAGEIIRYAHVDRSYVADLMGARKLSVLVEIAVSIYGD